MGMVLTSVYETNAPTVPIPVVLTVFVLMPKLVSAVLVWKVSGAIKTENSLKAKVLTAKKMKPSQIFQAKPETPLTFTPKSSLMTKNHSKQKKQVEMLPKCSRMPLQRPTVKTKRAKPVLEQSNRKISPLLALQSIQSVTIFWLASISLNLKPVSKLLALTN